MTVVPLDQVWVEANFREGQLRKMRMPAVKMNADLYGTSVTYGTIAGLDAGTGTPSRCCPERHGQLDQGGAACPCASRSIPRT